MISDVWTWYRKNSSASWAWLAVWPAGRPVDRMAGRTVGLQARLLDGRPSNLHIGGKLLGAASRSVGRLSGPVHQADGDQDAG